jgi:RNA polymerase sigma factor (sigma-70 family)
MHEAITAVPMNDNQSSIKGGTRTEATTSSGVELAVTRGRKAAPAAVALVIGLAAFTAQASESDLVRDIQRYCTVCWRNARLDPGLWDDCTQEVCCRLLTKARDGQVDLTQVLADDTPERKELVRAIDMVRKRIQRARRYQALDGSTDPISDRDRRERDQVELREILDDARHSVLTARQDRIIELWMRGWTVPDIADELSMSATRVSDEKYKALRKLERHLSGRNAELELIHHEALEGTVEPDEKSV